MNCLGWKKGIIVTVICRWVKRLGDLAGLSRGIFADPGR
jgi:hypothetical protein